MRILRYLIHASLVLSLSFAGLRASDTKASPSNSVSDNTTSISSAFQADKAPIEVTVPSPNSDTCVITIIKDQVSEVYNSFKDAAAASTGRRNFRIEIRYGCRVIVSDEAHLQETRSSTSEFQKPLASVNSQKVGELARGMDCKGYAAGLQLVLNIESFEGTFFRSKGEDQDNLSLVRNFFKHMQGTQISLMGKIFEYGQLVDGEPVPDINLGIYLSMAFGDISSILSLIQTYKIWREKNQGKRVLVPVVLDEHSTPLSSFDCHNCQMLSLESLSDLFRAQLKRQEALKKRSYLLLIQDALQKTSTIAKGGAIIGALVVALGVGIYYLFKKQWNHSKQRSHSEIKNRFKKAMQVSSIIGALGVYLSEPHPVNEAFSPAEDQQDNP